MKSKGVAYLLWFFLGFLGVHKFYVNKVGMGVLYIVLFITGTVFLGIPYILLGIGWLIDLFILGSQVDACNLAQSNANLLNQTAQLAQGTAVLSEQVAANQNLQYRQIHMQSSNSEVSNPPMQSQLDDKVAKLRKIKSLLDAGILTQEEFEAEKQNILNS